MIKSLRVKIEPEKPGLRIGDASLPVTIKALNSLAENAKLHLYRALIPLQVLDG